MVGTQALRSEMARSSGLVPVAALVIALLAGNTATAQRSQPEAAPKPAGVKRIGVEISGGAADAVRDSVVAMLQSDGTVIEAVVLTASLPALRAVEARRKECDFVLSATFEPKTAGGGFGKLTAAALGAVRDKDGLSKDFVSEDRRARAERQAKSVDDLVNRLAPKPTDKVQVTYKLTRVVDSTPLLSHTQEVGPAALSQLLEKFLNDVVEQALR